MDRYLLFQKLGGPHSIIHINNYSDKITVKQLNGLNLKCYKETNDEEFELISNSAVPAPSILEVFSETVGEGNFILEYMSTSGEVLKEVRYDIYTFQIQLDVDANRDSKIDENEIGKSEWTWGESSKGSIIMVNNDKDISDIQPINGEKSEMSKMIVRPTGIDILPEPLELVLYATPKSSSRFSIYRKYADNTLTCIMGKNSGSVPLNISTPLKHQGEELYIEAHDFPNKDFEGLITIELHLREKQTNGAIVGIDTVVMRVAPWIMTPNTLPAEIVYTCEMDEQYSGNEKFLEELSKACNKLNVPLVIIPPYENRGDRWIQDEIEIGYCESPTHIMPVVFDSPRDRELDPFPEKKLLGPDFGHFQIGGSTSNSLDSFGNLEVSPPVSVRGKNYPFGRIIFGGRNYSTSRVNAREIMPEIRYFLYAQKVQSPIEIYSDWLAVGHVDEIINFVPIQNEKGFKLLVASPLTTYNLLEDLRNEGYGDVSLFKGFRKAVDPDSNSAEITINEILLDDKLRKANETFQKYMNLNINILKEELGLVESDIVHVPVLFESPSTDERTLAYFPDMVNHLVIGDTSLIPKPYGPQINGECAFEKYIRDALPTRNAIFIDDWYSYHKLSGEVHCGTNVKRKPFNNIHWWVYDSFNR
ncbi:protein-arginine deiminase family protein [Bacillus thuringiensis]|uniref:protein-arginine deiminase family protein n=1 Tax=Bacillus thuringiensis TaxID=1428 RepID=UPI0020BFA4B1|nr:protein-arginine deiminase family protein [Bacillus thuringiensis]